MILVIALAECCKSPEQIIDKKTDNQSLTIEELDDTTTVETLTESTSMPTADGGTKNTTHETKRIIRKHKKRASEHKKVNENDCKIDGLTPILEKENTKRIKSVNKTKRALAKEERKKENQALSFRNLFKGLFFFMVAVLIYYFGKKR